MLKLTKEEIDACLTKLNSGDLLWVPYDPSTLKVGQYFDFDLNIIAMSLIDLPTL